MSDPFFNYDNWKLSSKYEDATRGLCDRCCDVLPIDSLEEIKGKFYCIFCVERLTDEMEEEE